MDMDATYRFLVANGERIKLRRYTGPGAFAEVECAARVMRYDADQSASGIVQADRVVVISNVEIVNAGWPGPPLVGDTVVLESYGGVTATVAGVDPAVLRGSVVRFTLQLRGS